MPITASGSGGLLVLGFIAYIAAKFVRDIYRIGRGAVRKLRGVKMKKAAAIVGLLVVLLVVGCTYVSPADRAVISTTVGNAQEVNNRVQADANLPPWLREWHALDSNSWLYWKHIANQEKP